MYQWRPRSWSSCHDHLAIYVRFSLQVVVTMVRLTKGAAWILFAAIELFSLVHAATSNTQRVVPGSYIVEFEEFDEVC